MGWLRSFTCLPWPQPRRSVSRPARSKGVASGCQAGPAGAGLAVGAGVGEGDGAGVGAALTAAGAAGAAGAEAGSSFRARPANTATARARQHTAAKMHKRASLRITALLSEGQPPSLITTTLARAGRQAAQSSCRLSQP